MSPGQYGARTRVGPIQLAGVQMAAGVERLPPASHLDTPPSFIRLQEDRHSGRLARPAWPKSSPTIPSTFYKVSLDEVGTEFFFTFIKMKIFQQT